MDIHKYMFISKLSVLQKNENNLSVWKQAKDYVSNGFLLIEKYAEILTTKTREQHWRIGLAKKK